MDNSSKLNDYLLAAKLLPPDVLKMFGENPTIVVTEHSLVIQGGGKSLVHSILKGPS